jgi:hypothetical protein
VPERPIPTDSPASELTPLTLKLAFTGSPVNVTVALKQWPAENTSDLKLVAIDVVIVPAIV